MSAASNHVVQNFLSLVLAAHRLRKHPIDSNTKFIPFCQIIQKLMFAHILKVNRHLKGHEFARL